MTDEILVFYDYKIRGVHKHFFGKVYGGLNDSIPTVPIAYFFPLNNKDDIIDLAIDLRRIYLKKGKKYRVKYFKYSRLLVDICEVTSIHEK